MTEIKPLQQGDEKDCSLVATMNCVRLNTPELVHIFTQDLADRLMKEYIMKHPRDAFRWLKEEKHYPLKYIPYSFAEAKIAMKKGRALICRRKYDKNWWVNIMDDWEANGSKPIDVDVGRGGHFFVVKAEGDKYRAWDSNTRMTYKIDLEHFMREGFLGKTFYMVR